MKSTVPAVHQDGTRVSGASGWWAVDEGEHGEGVLRHAHVRPLSVVVLDHDALVELPFWIPLLTLQRPHRGFTEHRAWALEPSGSPASTLHVYICSRAAIDEEIYYNKSLLLRFASKSWYYSYSLVTFYADVSGQ